MSESGTPHALPSWADQMQALEPVGDNLIAKWRPDGATEAEIQDMNKLALSILAERLPVPRLHRRAPAGVHAAVELRVQPGRSRPRLRVLDRPRSTRTASTGSPGFRGTSRFVEITQQSFDMMSPALMDGGRPRSRRPTTSTTSSSATTAPSA